MNQSSRGSSRSPLTLAGLAAICVVAGIVTTIASAPLAASLGIAGTLIALTLMWVIAIVEVLVWVRLGTSHSVGLRRSRAGDAVIAVAAGMVLAVAVPLLSLGTAMLTGQATGTVETAAQLDVGIAAVGVLTAAVTEEVIYRAAAMGAFIAMRAPTPVVLLVPALLFTIPHWTSWGPAHTAFVVFPLSLGLGGLYVWRRSLLVNAVAHLIADLPLVVVAATANG